MLTREQLEAQTYWRKCSNCKTKMDFACKHYVCNVSTCNRKRTGLVFCSVACWDAHVPMMNHRESWAIEKWAPGKKKWLAAQLEPETRKPRSPSTRKSPSPAPEKPKTPTVLVRRGGETRVSNQTASTTTPALDTSNDEILVVASKLKAYIKDRSGMNTSDGVLKALSHHIRAWADRAILSAKQHERKTVMDRDF